ncbi:MAG: putative O-methyltransferase YrrM [Crocinitomicaceae bacterium]|jgi:predicted O-methyltransferase YrrM
MNRSEILNDITAVLLDEQLDYHDLSKAMNSYKSILNSFATIALEDEESKKDIQMSNGIAIGMTWAARCIDDQIRTKRFIKGTFEAIQDQLKTKKSVHLLYAGTGPYGTLILPILSKFSPKQLKVTLLEINETSMKHVQQIIQELGFENSVVEYLNVDATTHVFEPDIHYDIVLSETMQHALVKEQQVPLFLNIMKQVSPSTLMIPENIQLDLVLIRSRSIEIEAPRKWTSMKTILNFNRSCIDSYNADKTSMDHSFIDVSLIVPQFDKSSYDHLAVTTKIHVYANEYINTNESGLTIPKTLERAQKLVSGKTKINLRYDISENSDYTLELRN